MIQRNFIVFINPISGTGSKVALQGLITQRMQKEKATFQILNTSKNGLYNFLPGKIIAEKISDIIICGGDGTVNQVVFSVLNVKVNIGIIPMGSGNGLAFAAGIPKNPSRALDIIFENKAAAVDAFFINRKFSCMLCGIGFDAQVAHDFAAQPARGLSTYIRQTVKNFFKATAYPFTVHANKSVIETSAFFISIANSNQFGNNVTIAPKASLSDGLLDIVIAGNTSKLNFLYSVLKQVRSGKVSPSSASNGPVLYFHTKKILIQNPGLAPLHIDGEPAETAASFNIEIMEKAFCLLQKTK